MKKLKLVLFFFIGAMMLISCGTSKEALTFRKAIDGNWQLQTVNTDGISGRVTVNLFNEADYNCFSDGAWNFNNSNSLGTYSINKTSTQCVPVKRNIRWSIYEATGEPKLLQFKRLDEKLNSLDNGDGFRFTIVQLDKISMQLKSNINFENKPASIIYNFVKIK